MLKFREFAEAEDEKQEEKALSVIRKGMNLQRSEDFWDDFLRVCGDSEGVSALLGVARDRITGLSGRVERLKEMIVDSNAPSKKDKMIKTGGEI